MGKFRKHVKIPFMKISVFTYLILLSTLPNALAQTASIDERLPYHTQAVYRNYETGQKRSVVNLIFKRTPAASKDTFLLLQEGRGDYDKLENVTWTFESEMKLENGLWLPLWTTKTFKSLTGNPLLIRQYRYDHENKKIITRAQDIENGTDKTITLPMKGLTLDSATLSFFLENFSIGVTAESPKKFYLVTSEQKLYEVNLKFMEEETLTINENPIESLKLRLIANMGILDEVFDRFIPPTFMWFEKNPADGHRRWLKYEGLETSLNSKRVIAELNPQP